MTTATRPAGAVPARSVAARSAAERPPEAASDPLRLARRLLDHQDIASMVRALGRSTGSCVTVEHPRGTPVATHPAIRPATGREHQPLAEFPIQYRGVEVGVIRHSTWLDRQLIELAAAIFVHPLLREVDRDLAEQRRLGHALQSVAEGEGTGRELRALLRRRGLDPDRRLSVVAARDGGSAATWLGATCGTTGRHACAAALLDDQHLLVLQDAPPAGEHARNLLARLERSAVRRAAVGIGEAPGGADDLRTALLEAREAALRGPGINDRAPLTIDRILRALPSAALEEHARILLDPVIRHDAERQTELLRTLRVLVAEDFSIVRAARALFVHQNTVKYRAAQLAELTGVELGRIDGRAQLWIALTLRDEHRGTPAP